ncbi:MAG: hypothetical protein WCI31_14405, partial [Prolixibacteraceae bacterium]
MIPSKSTSLRQEAEEQLIQKSSKTSSQLSEADVLKLNHELQVHQIELEMQKAELQLANEAAVTAIKEYTELYNLAPMGYFTLSKEGEITGLNLGGAKMLGKERYYLLGTRFGFFVTNQSKPIFNDFLDKVFTSKAEETSELKLSFEGYSEKYVQLSGILNNNGEQCFVTMLDITKSKHKEKEKREAELIIANKERTFQNEEKGKRAAELIVAN